MSEVRLIDANALKEDLEKWFPKFTLEGIEPKTLFNQILHDIDNAPTVKTYCYFCGQTEHGIEEEMSAKDYNLYLEGYKQGYKQGKKDFSRQGECKSCRHRDPEDKKCDCGGQERQGCLFPVNDDYYCKYYKRGGAE